MKQNNWFDPFYLQDYLTEEEKLTQANVRNFCDKVLKLNVVKNIIETIHLILI